MTVESKDCEHVTILELKGELSPESAGQVRTILGECMRSGRSNIVVDLEGLSDISYVGIGVLVERLRQVRARNGDIKLVSPTGWMRRIFSVVGANVFEMYDSVEASLRSFYVTPFTLERYTPSIGQTVGVG
jgi:anti-sigma B factor antagonist